MAITIQPIPLDVAQSFFAKNAKGRTSEPRDTIHTQLVVPFLASGMETWAIPLVDEDENIVGLRGITWNDLLSDTDGETCGKNVCDRIIDKNADGADVGVADIHKVVNQHANKLKWRVDCRMVNNPDNTVGITFTNLDVRDKRIADAAAASKAAKEAAAEKAASK